MHFCVKFLPFPKLKFQVQMSQFGHLWIFNILNYYIWFIGTAVENIPDHTFLGKCVIFSTSKVNEYSCK